MPVSADFPFESNFVDVHGSKMHYVESGEGTPILFLHGNPTSSYLWRNVIPYAARHGRAIAVDLIGMGRSDKPNLDYRFFDHLKYVEGFVEAMSLHDIVLVLHDWGGGLGVSYARRHPDNVVGIAAMEAVLRTSSWSDTNLMERLMFKRMRHPVKGDRMNLDKNFFVRRILPMMVKRKLTKAELDAYGAPFTTRESRKPVAVWPREIPFDGEPVDMQAEISANYAWYKSVPIPKLFLHAKPGVIFKKAAVEELEREVAGLESRSVGDGKHYIQEDNPDAIGNALEGWLPTVLERHQSPSTLVR